MYNGTVAIKSLYDLRESELLQEYTVSFYMRRSWRDPQLRFDHLTNLSRIIVSSEKEIDVWAPDVFFVNERVARFHELTFPNQYVRISSDGEVLLSSRFVFNKHLLKPATSMYA